MAVGGANNISIAPVNALWRIEGEYVVDHNGLSNPDGVYWTIDSSDGDLYYVWYNLDAGSVDPAPAGRTGIAVAVTTGDSASTIAAAAQAAIDGNADFSATVSGTEVTVKQVAVGKPASDPVDVDSGVTITLCRRGQNLDLGLLNGNVELSFAPANFIVQAHQTGVTPRAALFQGVETAEVSLELLETVTSNLKEIYGVYGTDGFTPSTSEVYGVGTSKQGNNLLVDAARLELKPVNAADDTTNTTLMLALPVPDTLVFSGEDPKTLSVTFQGFIDDSKDSRVSALLFGDPGQTGL